MAEEKIYGYDVVFLEQPSFEVSCSICLLTLEDPVQVNPCGHRFCNDCIENLRKSRRRLPFLCPIDNGEIQNTFADKGMERMILNLRIQCTENHKGCMWTGELGKLEAHLTDCGYLEITCTNDNCESKMERRHLQSHLCTCSFRTVECAYCLEEYIFIDKEEHEDQCRKFFLNCQNKCGEYIPRDEMDEHVKEQCQNTIHPCEYTKIGCLEKGTRAWLQEHLETGTKTHLSYAVGKLEDYEVRLSQQSEQLENLQKSSSQQNEQIQFLAQLCGKFYKLHPYEIESQPFELNIENFNSKLESADDEITSDPFYCLNGHKSQLLIDLNNKSKRNTYVSVHFCLTKGPFDDVLDWPFKGIVNISVRGKKMYFKEDEFDSTIEEDFIECFQKPITEKNAGFKFRKFLSHDVVEKYVINDILTITCDVRNAAEKAKNHDLVKLSSIEFF